VLPDVKPRIRLAAEAARQSKREGPAQRSVLEITPHLVIDVVIPVEGGAMRIGGEAYATWGVPHDEVFRTAARNLAKRSEGSWQVTKEAPGVYRSPWRDSYDVARLMLPRLFGRAPLRGRPVAVGPTTSRLLFAGDEDPEGLFHLGRLARRVIDQDPAFLFLRPVRLGADGESWEDWLPPRGHPAFDVLRMLRALEEKRDYDAQTEFHRRFARPGTPPPPALAILQSSVDGQTLTVTHWTAGPPTALPKADLIVMRRGDEVLGYTEWETVARALPGELKPLPGYPARFLAADFPEEWRLGDLDLKPWSGPT
jgi:hypothetical protein